MRGNRDFYYSPVKYESRSAGVNECRSHRGIFQIPEGRHVLSMCSHQTRNPLSEIQQYLDMGFMREGQFVGIDRVSSIIKENEKQFPDDLFLCGEWIDQIQDPRVRPAYIHLDTICEPKKAAKLALATMERFSSDVTLLINVIQGNASNRRLYDPELFVEILRDNAFSSTIAAFRLDQDPTSYPYVADNARSLMRTYVYHA